MKIAIDAMGGDRAPGQIVAGAVRALRNDKRLSLVLVGKEDQIRTHLPANSERIKILHTDTQILADDEPVRAVRRKKKASMVLAVEQVKNGQCQAAVSAGNTGALMTSGLFVLGRLAGIERPALAPTLPTTNGNGVLLLDAGANTDARPAHLLSYARMAAVYVEKVRGRSHPVVGLLNVGTEAGKGNALARETYDLLKETPLSFAGNVEARDLLNGDVDIVVTDGFTGNVVLKAIEGTALTLFSRLKKEITKKTVSRLAAAMLKPRFRALKKEMDYSEYGGALLLGLTAPVVKAHGSSDANAIYHAICQAQKMVENDVINKISAEIATME